MYFAGVNQKMLINIFAIYLLANYGSRFVRAKTTSNDPGRCPDLNMLNSLQQAFNLRRMELMELYCKKRYEIAGTPVYKCSPVICTAKSHYQSIWQVGEKDFHKRLYIEIELLEKARRNIRNLQNLLENGEKSRFKILRSSIGNDMVSINTIMQVCYHSAPRKYPDIKRAMNGDFLKFPLSKEKATACSSGGQWQQLTFIAELIQLYNDMYDSIVDVKSE